MWSHGPNMYSGNCFLFSGKEVKLRSSQEQEKSFFCEGFHKRGHWRRSQKVYFYFDCLEIYRQFFFIKKATFNVENIHNTKHNMDCKA